MFGNRHVRLSKNYDILVRRGRSKSWDRLINLAQGMMPMRGHHPVTKSLKPLKKALATHLSTGKNAHIQMLSIQKCLSISAAHHPFKDAQMNEIKCLSHLSIVEDIWRNFPPVTSVYVVPEPRFWNRISCRLWSQQISGIWCFILQPSDMQYSNLASSSQSSLQLLSTLCLLLYPTGRYPFNH